MPESPPASARRRRLTTPIPYGDRRRLLATQRRIEDGRTAADERAAIMAELHARGHTYASIAAVLGVQHEMVRKAILSRTAEGYPHRSTAS